MVVGRVQLSDPCWWDVRLRLVRYLADKKTEILQDGPILVAHVPGASVHQLGLESYKFYNLP